MFWAWWGKAMYGRRDAHQIWPETATKDVISITLKAIYFQYSLLWHPRRGVMEGVRIDDFLCGKISTECKLSFSEPPPWWVAAPASASAPAAGSGGVRVAAN